jgi:hypothetical protein
MPRARTVFLSYGHLTERERALTRIMRERARTRPEMIPIACGHTFGRFETPRRSMKGSGPGERHADHLVAGRTIDLASMGVLSATSRVLSVHGSRGSRENLNESRVCNPWRFQGGPSLSLHEPRCTHRNGAFK